ncbi:MAG: hypothetical protein IT262_03760 [Saprospiraceae bacterium]|nr:hypothetical protein [Saprospiraceae bacterium]
MKKALWLIFICSVLHSVSAQKTMEATNAFTIEGIVKKSLVVTLDSLKKITVKRAE